MINKQKLANIIKENTYVAFAKTGDGYARFYNGECEITCRDVKANNFGSITMVKNGKVFK